MALVHKEHFCLISTRDQCVAKFDLNVISNEEIGFFFQSGSCMWGKIRNLTD